ncbi:DUF3618 domain-containing protein [Actinokineospora enzanensis]|uniref:DUF3618 domain-containing protein n=1 Tax=Actinokineospora enzanensis TaxID=155975 RepID=UPI00036A6788|nr:DUF3618 domain-containing protein [Actinokineospora enzanensis]
MNGDRQVKDDTLRADIELTRQELAGTVDALVAKTDVKRRVGERAHQVKDKVDEASTQAVELVRRKPVPVAAVGAGVAALVVALLLLLRRGR